MGNKNKKKSLGYYTLEYKFVTFWEQLTNLLNAKNLNQEVIDCKPNQYYIQGPPHTIPNAAALKHGFLPL